MKGMPLGRFCIAAAIADPYRIRCKDADTQTIRHPAQAILQSGPDVSI
jgi:hypothetical protein